VTQLSRDKYVAFNSALRQPGGKASVGHNISAENTYPKKLKDSGLPSPRRSRFAAA
jgi:hypothetical protein